MKLEKREPLNFSENQTGPLAVEPDNDLELPTAAIASPESLGSLTPASQALSPTGAPAVQTQPRRVALEAPAFGRGLYWAAFLASILWAALSVYALGYQGLPTGVVDFQPYQIGVFVVFAITPIGFFWIAAYCVRQSAMLSAAVVRTKALAEDMLEPAAIAASETGTAVLGVRLEIEAATAAAGAARAELMALHRSLAEETARLTVAAEASARTAHTLADRLSQEREAMTGLSNTLESRAGAVAESITRQAQMVAEASDLAQTQIGEAEAALAARAADLATAAGDATEAAKVASGDLARQVARLETATIGVSDQIGSMEDALTQQRASLVSAAHTLRADHEDFSVKIETQRAQLAEIVATAQLHAADLGEAAAVAGESIGELAAVAAAQAQEFAQNAKAERDLLAASALQTLGALSEAARFERESLQAESDRVLSSIGDTAARETGALEETAQGRLAMIADTAKAERDALEADALRGLDTMTQAAETANRLAEGYNETARRKLQELSELAFTASQQAEQTFQARLGDADTLIKKSAELIDQATARTADRLEQSTVTAKVMLEEMEKAFTEFETRAARLPMQTEAQAAQLRSALASGFDSILASARAAADETLAIDAAFQERVRRNYEMLSEAARLMGVVSGRPGAPTPTIPRPFAAEPAPIAPEPAPREAAPAPRKPFPFAARTPSAAALVAGLRPRLKLSPTAADTEVSQVFESAGEAAPAEGGGGWTWQELLSSMDDAPVEDGQLMDRLLGEIENLGVDLAALFPQARIDEIAAVLEAGDTPGARAVVRHLAPAAVRRLSRRAMSERALRAHAERFVRGYTARIDEAARHAGGGALAGLLGSEDGRVFLLFDAALGDLG